MNKFKEGDCIKSLVVNGSRATVLEIVDGCNYDLAFADGSGGTLKIGYVDANFELISSGTVEENNAVSPNVYKFPNAEVRDISAHLTSFGGQAVQYVARATRLDGLVKGKPEQDIEKAIQVLQWELERLQAVK